MRSVPTLEVEGETENMMPFAFSPSLLLIPLSRVPLFTILLEDLKDSCSNKQMLKLL